jgi:hypothetical protein
VTIAGVLMIHDEAGTVGRAVESFAQVCDPIIGLDVGSTDGAADIARDLGVEMHAQDFTTHGAAAEELLRLSRDRADYTLLFGATETMALVEPLPELAAPMYVLPTTKEGVQFRTDRLFRSGIDWTCPGPVHSTMQPYFYDERQNLDAIVVTQHDDDGRRLEKLARYRDELEAWLIDHPDDSRSTYYLAQSYYFLGAMAAAAALYTRRASMSNGDVEQWHAMYMAGCSTMAYNFEQGAVMLLEAFRRRPERVEPLHALEQACHMLREKAKVPTEGDDLLWLMPEVYLG